MDPEQIRKWAGETPSEARRLHLLIENMTDEEVREALVFYQQEQKAGEELEKMRREARS